jgi:hypothetical protein
MIAERKGGAIFGKTLIRIRIRIGFEYSGVEKNSHRYVQICSAV